MGNPYVLKVVKIACDVCKGNPDGFYECNADAIPEGAVLFEEAPVEKPLTVAEIKAKLTELKIEFPANAKKPALLALLPTDEPEGSDEGGNGDDKDDPEE